MHTHHAWGCKCLALVIVVCVCYRPLAGSTLPVSDTKTKHTKLPGNELGCYFCSDVVAPTNVSGTEACDRIANHSLPFFVAPSFHSSPLHHLPPSFPFTLPSSTPPHPSTHAHTDLNSGYWIICVVDLLSQ